MSQTARARTTSTAASAAPKRAPSTSPDESRRRHLRVVDATARRRRRRVHLAVWAFGLVTGLSVFVAVAFHVMLAQSEFQLARLSKETAAAQLRYEKARLGVAQLESPNRIVDRATKLGMVTPSRVRYVTAPVALGPGSSTTDIAAGASTRDWERVKRHLAAQP